MRACLSLVSLSIATVAACFDGSLPQGAFVSCTSDDDCPAPSRCQAELCRLAGDDLTPPSIVGVVDVAPLVVGQGQSVDIRFAISEQGDATVRAIADDGGAVPVDAAADDDDGARALRFAGPITSARDTTWRIEVTLVDVAGNRVVIADAANFASDVTPPALLDAAADPRGDVGPGDDLTVSLTTSESATATLEGEGIATTTLETTGVTHRFAVRVNDDARDGPLPVTATLVDAVGNAATVPALTLAVDATPPVVVEARARFVPEPGAAVASVTAATNGTTVEFDLEMSEPVADLVLTLQPLNRTLERVVDDGDVRSTWGAVIELVAGEQDGPQDLHVEAVDEAGNVADIVVPAAIVVDTTPPDAPDFDMQNIVYVRAPFGDGVAGRTRRFAVRSEGPVRTASGDIAAQASVAVVDDPDADFASVVGIARVDEGGLLVETPLSGIDRSNVWLRAIDDAGNLSASAVAVELVDFIVTPRGVGALASDHTLRADLRSGETGLRISSDSLVFVDAPERAGAVDGVVVDVDAPRLPRTRDLDMPVRLVAGDPCAPRDDEVFCVDNLGVVSFDGDNFVRRRTNDDSGDGDPVAAVGVLDIAREIVSVVVDGEEIAMTVAQFPPNSCDGCNFDCGDCVELGPATPMALWRLGDDDDWHPDPSFVAPTTDPSASLLALEPQAVVFSGIPRAVFVGDGASWVDAGFPPGSVELLTGPPGVFGIATSGPTSTLWQLEGDTWVERQAVPPEFVDPQTRQFRSHALADNEELWIGTFTSSQLIRWNVDTSELRATPVPFSSPLAVARLHDEVMMGQRAQRFVDGVLRTEAVIVPPEAVRSLFFDFPIRDTLDRTRAGPIFLSRDSVGALFFFDISFSIEFGIPAVSADGARQLILGDRLGPRAVSTLPGFFPNVPRTRQSDLPPRQRACVAFDDAREVVVVFGGIDPGGQVLDDVWETSFAEIDLGALGPQQQQPPLRWTQVDVTDPEGDGSPAPRFDAVMRSDPAGGVVVLGGISALTQTQEAWRFDGRSFARLPDVDDATFFAIRTNTDRPRAAQELPAHRLDGWLETRPTLVFDIDVDSAGYAALGGEVQSVRVEVVAAGSGHSSGAAADGYRLLLGGTEHGGEDATPLIVTAPPSVTRVALTTNGDNRLGTARLSVDALVATIRFHVPP